MTLMMMIPTNPPKVKRLLFSIGLDDSVDLLTEILLRLPVKSLSRFKSVCKRWQSIISSDYFCHQHTLRHPRLQPSVIIRVNSRDFFYWNGGKKMTPYSSSNIPLYTLLQACNGLMLLQSQGFNDCLSNEGRYYVYSLTTRKSRKIVLNRNNEHPRLAVIGLAFDPSISPYYKIVSVYPSNTKGNHPASNNLTYEVEVYDSESHSWKLALEAAFVPRLYYSVCVTQYCNNKIYWENICGYCYFDVDKNEMKIRLFPVTPNLQESNGRLYYCRHRSRESVAVWELVGDDDGTTIFKQHAPVDKTSIVRLMAAGSNGDETCRLLTHTGGKIRVYSFGDQTHEDLIDLTTQPRYQPKNGRFYVECFQFGETLALV